MTCGRKSTWTGKYFVYGTFIDSVSWLYSILLWYKPNNWHFSVELFRIRVVKKMSNAVPTSSLHKHTIDVATILWFFSDFTEWIFVNYLEVKLEFINGDNMFSSIVLKCGSEESLWEEESWNPECRWRSIIDPLSKEGNTFQKLTHPWGQRLQWKETFISPDSGNLVVEETCTHLFKILRHDNFSD